MFLCFCHSICKIRWGFPRESFEEVAWQEAYDQSHKFDLVNSLGDHDGLTIESRYVTAKAFLRVLHDAEQVGGQAFDLLVGYDLAKEL